MWKLESEVAARHTQHILDFFVRASFLSHLFINQHLYLKWKLFVLIMHAFVTLHFTFSNRNYICTPEVGSCEFVCWRSVGDLSNRSTSLVITYKRKSLRGNSYGTLQGIWKEPQHIRSSQEAPRRIIKEMKQAVKKAFSYLQMLTFQTRHPSTNWQVLMVLTFRGKVPQVLTFSKGGLLSDSFNSLGPHPFPAF